jgi:hypothetical protein
MKNSEPGAPRDPAIVKDEEERALKKQRDKLQAVLDPGKKSKKDE